MARNGSKSGNDALLAGATGKGDDHKPGMGGESRRSTAPDIEDEGFHYPEELRAPSGQRPGDPPPAPK